MAEERFYLKRNAKRSRKVSLVLLVVTFLYVLVLAFLPITMMPLGEAKWYFVFPVFVGLGGGIAFHLLEGYFMRSYQRAVEQGGY